MGMYDSVNMSCPECDEHIELQSKAGECLLIDHSPDNLPHEIARDLHGESVICQKCRSRFVVMWEVERIYKVKLVQ